MKKQNEQVEAVIYNLETAAEYESLANKARKLFLAFEYGNAFGCRGCADQLAAQRDWFQYARLANAWREAAFDYATGL